MHREHELDNVKECYAPYICNTCGNRVIFALPKQTSGEVDRTKDIVAFCSNTDCENSELDSADFSLCWTKPLEKINKPMVKPLIEMLYECHSAGCCLHIVTDDGNVSNHNVEFCIECAVERTHEFCKQVGILLRKMSKTQRSSKW